MKLCLAVDWDRHQLCITEPVQEQFKVQLSLRYHDFQVKGDTEMAVTLKDTEKVTASISVVDGKGNPAKIDGAPVWASSDEAGLSVVAAEDGFSAVVAAVGPLGNYQATVTVDADLGEGVTPLVGILDVEVVAGEAVAISFSVSAPEPA